MRKKKEDMGHMLERGFILIQAWKIKKNAKFLLKKELLRIYKFGGRQNQA